MRQRNKKVAALAGLPIESEPDARPEPASIDEQFAAMSTDDDYRREALELVAWVDWSFAWADEDFPLGLQHDAGGIA